MWACEAVLEMYAVVKSLASQKRSQPSPHSRAVVPGPAGPVSLMAVLVVKLTLALILTVTLALTLTVTLP